ncbi:putative leucine rich repeat domain protein [Paratrimastix pyriformis]|uniref:Leucine rich repeat domain protein n=1 Tax=Paratrimastix pyriformis TaxID=342808 RepID=A0ABQ8V017_9EUKA|nr:putative leucine rich repeat domain protein [Paratrimastix pyriformis]
MKLCLALLLFGVALAQIPDFELQVLTDLYDVTNGGQWQASDNWKNGKDPCTVGLEWYGITCDTNGSHVITIDLTLNNLQGPIPPSISQLSHLERLYLGLNKITGDIDPLCGLSKLQTLTMPGNYLNGEVPQCFITNNRLASVDFENNQLQGFLYPFFQLPQLQSLDVSGNNIGGRLPAFDRLPRLSFFDVASNRLTGTIPPMDGLANLVFANLSDNGLYGPIPSFNPFVEAWLLDLRLQCPTPDGQLPTVHAPCSYCAPGYGHTAISRDCDECDAGTYSDGTSRCIPCPANSYAPNRLTDQCSKCPAGTFAPEGSAQCYLAGGAGDASATATLVLLVVLLVLGGVALLVWLLWGSFLGGWVKGIFGRIRGRRSGHTALAPSAAEEGAAASVRSPGERQPILGGGSYGSVPLS